MHSLRTVQVWLIGLLYALLLLPYAHSGALQRASNPTENHAMDSYALLVIGVSDYTHWARIPHAINDGEKVFQLFRNLGAQVERNDGANKASMESALRDFASRHGNSPEKKVIIYYAGHGHATDDGRGFLIPKDAPTLTSDSTLAQYAVNVEIFNELANSMKSQKALFILDSCFSGSIFNTMLQPPPHAPPRIGKEEDHVRAIITAGGAKDTVPDDSHFRKSLVNGITGAADLDSDGFVTSVELGIHLVREMKKINSKNLPRSDRRGWGNEPAIGDFFIPVPYRSPKNSSPIAPPPRQTETARLPGSEFVDECNDLSMKFTLAGRCPVPKMRVLPPGEFLFGSSIQYDHDERADDEAVAETNRPITLSHGLSLSETEITFNEWDACVQDGGCDRWPDDEGWGRGQRPVIHVSWHDAQQYVRWLSTQTNARYRLPTEKEWEYAAKAGSTTRRPWGDKIGMNNGNCRECGNPDAGRRTTPVGEFPANVFKLKDMLGNVWEWVAEGCYQDFGQAEKTCDPSLRVVRGGSYATSAKGVRSAARGSWPAHDTRAKNIGFRVARDVIVQVKDSTRK
ncbi:MAG: SUMF1/EgtB/PvdO family nonheme iron enzyme [Magnetococcales bacterium]|nr:SUMF1/EgtB/PvdO family nonheme iron enzyme [Magnetococcales bacterium]